MAQVVRHRQFRDIEQLVNSANDAALGLLVGDRIARADLAALPAADRKKQLSELYSSSEVEDIGRFDFLVSPAERKLLAAERELCVMAVPFAISLYNEYLVSAAGLLELGHIARSRRDPQELMLGKLEAHLRDHGVSVAGDWLGLLRVVQTVRNRIIHAGGIPGEAAVSKWERLPPKAQALWTKVTGRPMPLGAPTERLEWGGPEIRGVFLVVRQALRQINESLQSVLPREFWADLVIHELRVESPQARGSRSGAFFLRRAIAAGYGSLGFTSQELRDAVERAPHTGWRPDLAPYWQRSVPPGPAETQVVSGRDLTQGRVRIPIDAKGLFPSSTQMIHLKLRELDLDCNYNPAPESHRPRSGVIYVGDRLRELVVAGQVLSIFRISPTEVGLQ
jgi:hypothetical protein